MALQLEKSKRHEVTASEWVNLEEKQPDNPRSAGGSNFMRVTLPGKGKGKKGKGKAMVLHIPRSLMPELKRMFNAAFWDAETLDNPTGPASSYEFFNQITQGVGATQRIGDCVFIENIVLRLQLQQSPSISQCTTVIELIGDKQPAAVIPTWNDIFQGIGGASAVAYLTAIPNFDERNRFRYLQRETIPMSWSAIAFDTGNTQHAAAAPKSITINLPIKKKIMYNGTGGVYAGMTLYLWAWSELTANTPHMNGSFEIFFTDA